MMDDEWWLEKEDDGPGLMGFGDWIQVMMVMTKYVEGFNFT